MELRQFAEQILFATDLEEKLRCPAVITDAQPGVVLSTPKAPGRPGKLHFKAKGSGQRELPKVHELERERERGRLLHFFANHELLATELMALVLLRFPEAPPDFRRGVLQTLKDEQEHTRLYIRRMQECGIQFGELPVSGYFWHAISNMQNPMEYVAGLSLTFEQANLDFASDFARRFEAVGDLETARLLQRIYRDEISHVAYGLKWFRRWKNPQQDDWDEFCRHLKFPLSPQRAKGPALNVEGRLAAGFNPAFIDQLNVYSQSKGRTPRVFVFNPLAEARIAQGRSFTPVKAQEALERDLADLPQFLCSQDDVVLVRDRPSVAFLKNIKEAGFDLPEFVELKNGRVNPTNPVNSRKIAGFRPWAWGPDIVELLEPLFPNRTGGALVPNRVFNENIARLYSKEWSAGFLRKILSQCPEQSWLCTEQEVGVDVESPEQALETIAAIRRRGHHKIVLKETIGLAGHNSVRLWEPELSESQRRWIENAFNRGQRIVVEPWLEREVDFSIQLEAGADGLKLCGYTGLINDLKGQFQANWAAPNFRQRIPAQVASCFGAPSDISVQLHRLYHDIFKLLAQEFRSVGYEGPAGIDAFVYRNAQGECRLKPIVEINPRYTMGRVTVELMRHVCPGSYGLFRLVNRAQLRRLEFDTFPAYAQALSKRFPLCLEGNPVRKIREGIVCLTDPERAEACLATFQVSRTHISTAETR
jgi:uncharacterized ferritin-like protein (DUF455 family)